MTSHQQALMNKVKGNIPLNDLAHQFGGGGHKFACGAMLYMDTDKATSVIIEKAKKLL